MIMQKWRKVSEGYVRNVKKKFYALVLSGNQKVYLVLMFESVNVMDLQGCALIIANKIHALAMMRIMYWSLGGIIVVIY